MPYKNKDKQRRAVKKAVHRIRQHRATLKHELKADVNAMQKLIGIPKAYELIFGKPKRKTKKKRHTK